MHSPRTVLLNLHVALIACHCLLGSPMLTMAQTANESERAGDRFENVSALTNIPADQMGKVMNMMSAALGVNCSYCHAGTDFAKEGHPHKDIAREMLEMTLSLNREHFGGKAIITCTTCHQGKMQPVSTLPLDPLRLAAEPKPSSTSPEKAPAIPDADRILANYIQALGGEARLAAVKSRHVAGQRIEPDGRMEPEELWQNVEGLSRMQTLYGDLAVIEGFDGQAAWKQAAQNSIQLKPDEAEQVQTEVGVAFPTTLKTYYKDLTAGEPMWNGDHWLHVLLATRRSGLKETLVFDSRSGLLVERTASVPTVLGMFQHRIDYSDYQAFEGIQVPTTIRFAIPNITWTRRITTVTFNPTLAEAHFRRP